MAASAAAVSPEQKEKLIGAARAAYERSYAPYSKFRVGAAILLESGEVFVGCNVENASYGLTNCAERSAIFAAVSQLGGEKVRLRAVAVVNDHEVACSPCGACRQVMGEFSSPEMVVYYLGANGIVQRTMRELLPDCFSL